jgi:mercuric reductase
VAAERFDLVILGSGSTAFAAALKAQELGKTAVMTEERTIGGTCVNRGCLPSKNLIEAARILHEAKNPRYPGISKTAPELDFRSLIAQKDEVVASYRRKKYESLIGGSVRIERGHARFLDAHAVDVDGMRLEGENVLIATGSRPVVPQVEGLADVPYLTSDLLTAGEEGELEELPDSILIVGGGYIALELGQMFRRFGSEVTIVERSREILSRGYEPEVGPVVRKVLQDEGVLFATDALVRAVRRDGSAVVASLEGGRGSEERRAWRLVVAAGRRPNSDRIALEASGVSAAEHGGVRVDAYLRTNVPHIFAAGDVIGSETGSQMATPVGSHDGGLAAHNALSGEAPRAADHRVVPCTIFTDPQVAVVGVTEEEAIAAGRRCWCSTLPMSLVPRAGAIRDTRGIVKMVADEDTGEVLGVSMVGHSAGEVIHEAAMALRFRAKLTDFVDQLHVYPTMAEALKIVAISRFKDPEKLSCCAE